MTVAADSVHPHDRYYFKSELPIGQLEMEFDWVRAQSLLWVQSTDDAT